MNLSLKGFPQLIEDMGAALQSSASTLVDVSVGSIVRAIFEANASVVLWLQWLIVQVLQSTRASTSNGVDLDSWMMDFGISRLAAMPSMGTATFSRFAANLPAAIPVGTLVKTADGSVSFSVVANATSSIWQSASSAYVIPGGVSSADIEIVCTGGGSAGNVLSGAISVIAASLPGIDQVINASSLTSGADAESDQAFRARFQSYLASRSRATLVAVRNAIANVRQGINVKIEENTGSDGTSQIGSFLVIVDDGSGYPSADLLAAISIAVDFVRPIGTRFAVLPPQVLTVNVAMVANTLSSENAYLHVPNIQSYVEIYLNTLQIGGTASVTRVAQHAYLGSNNTGYISGVTMNGLGLDIVPPPFTVVKAGVIVVTKNAG